MILKDNLYSVSSSKKDADTLTFSVQFIPENVIFRSHFPKHPITPGVCIIQIAQELLSLSLGEKLVVDAVKNAKFLQPIEPDSTPCVDFVFSHIVRSEDDIISFQTVVRTETAVMAKLSFSCKVAK